MANIFRSSFKWSMLACLLLCWQLSSCAMLGEENSISRYQANQPQLDLEKFFVGKLSAWGMFQQRSGAVVKRFHVHLEGKMLDGQLQLKEDFLYDDGSQQQRIWYLRKQADGSWRGKADDVEGEAIADIAGNAMHWRYTLLLPVNGTTYAMKMDDWMFLLDENTMLNRTSMRKFGVEVGQVTLFFRRQI